MAWDVTSGILLGKNVAVWTWSQIIVLKCNINCNPLQFSLMYTLITLIAE